MRLIYYICAILVACLIVCCIYANSLKKDNKRLEAEANGYKQEIKRQREVIENVQERKEVVEKLVYKDKEVFDWRADISNTAVVNELRLQCKACGSSAY